MAYVQYSVFDTANDKLDSTELYNEIVAASAWLSSCEGIVRRADQFRVFFPAAPPTAERLALDAVVAAHSGTVPAAPYPIHAFPRIPGGSVPGADANKALRVVRPDGTLAGYIPVYDTLW